MDLLQFLNLYKQLKMSLQIHLLVIHNPKELINISKLHKEVFGDTQLQHLNIVLKSLNLCPVVFDININELISHAKVQSRISRVCQYIKNIICCKP
ncbi:unnamed protein product [Paramecium octaurelia]|uniref:Uncharacterized protein n=1 Tax=Paramecium octaurelia TaxID=43137 RepID=A0A8S1V5J9_PAROT|nr:unnamed protein product [Paramecium octaurelia]